MSTRELLARERERKAKKRRQRAERRVLRILRLPEVQQRTGKSVSGIYADIARGLFPAPVPLGPRAVGWVEAEIDAYLEACVARRDDGSVERSLPLAGLNQRRKAEALPPPPEPPQPPRKPQREPSTSRHAGHEAAR
jgi:prophage regulatory protein